MHNEGGPTLAPHAASAAGEDMAEGSRQDLGLGATWLRTGPESPSRGSCTSSSSLSSNSAASTWTQQPSAALRPGGADKAQDELPADRSSGSPEGSWDMRAAGPKLWDRAARRPPALYEADGGACGTPTAMGSPGIQERRCPRWLWQPDTETDVCSMEDCDTAFVSSFFAVSSPHGPPVSRRHHCRQCGRLVCSACSTGQKSLLNKDCKPGSASLARVCNACMQGSETFNFRRGTNIMDKQANKNAILRRLMWQGGASPEASVNPSRRSSGTLQGDLQDMPGMRRNALSLPSLAGFFGSGRRVDGSPTNGSSSGSPQDKPMSDYDLSRNEDGELDPSVVCTQAPPPVEEKAVAPPPEEEKDERLQKIEKELAASSYYQGLLRHEPAALRALTGLMTSTAN